jgi:hypothetical protein
MKGNDERCRPRGRIPMWRVSSRATDSSDETSVMEVDRCGGWVAEQLGNEDDAVTNPKPYDISKRKVLEACRRVKANRGAAGIDGESLSMFEADLAGNLQSASQAS